MRRALQISLMVLLCQLAPSTARAASDQRRAEHLLHEGSEQFSNREYDRALASFQAAFSLVPSPLILFDMAKTELKLDKPVIAAQHFHDFLRQAPNLKNHEHDVAEATASLAKLEATVARLRIRTDPPRSKVIVDDVATKDDEDLIYVNPGSHIILATALGKTAQSQVSVGVGELQDLVLTLGTPVPASLSRLNVRTEPPGASIQLDRKPQGVTPLVTDVPPGAHTLVARLDGYTDLNRDLSTLPGTTSQLQLTLSPATPRHGQGSQVTPNAAKGASLAAPEKTPPLITKGPEPLKPEETTSQKAWWWTDVGLGALAVAATGGGIGFGLGAQAANTQLVSNHHSQAAANGLVQTLHTRELAANASYGVAGLAAATAVAVFCVKVSF